MLPPARMDFQISDDENQNFFSWLNGKIEEKKKRYAIRVYQRCYYIPGSQNIGFPLESSLFISKINEISHFIVLDVSPNKIKNI